MEYEQREKLRKQYKIWNRKLKNYKKSIQIEKHLASKRITHKRIIGHCLVEKVRIKSVTVLPDKKDNNCWNIKFKLQDLSETGEFVCYLNCIRSRDKVIQTTKQNKLNKLLITTGSSPLDLDEYNNCFSLFQDLTVRLIGQVVKLDINFKNGRRNFRDAFHLEV